MKTASEILNDKIRFVTNNQMSPGLRKAILQAMKEYAEQALDEASKVADAGITFLGNLAELDDIEPYIVGEDFEVYVINSSILDVKKLLK